MESNKCEACKELEEYKMNHIGAINKGVLKDDIYAMTIEESIRELEQNCTCKKKEWMVSLEAINYTREIEIVSGRDRVAFIRTTESKDGVALTNANLIVKAVNSHHELLEALECMLNIFGRDLRINSIGDVTCSKAKQAIKKAEKE